MDLLWFILAAYGLTQMLVYGSIFDSIRPTKGSLGSSFSVQCVWATGWAYFCSALTTIQNYLRLSILPLIF